MTFFDRMTKKIVRAKKNSPSPNVLGKRFYKKRALCLSSIKRIKTLSYIGYAMNMTSNLYFLQRYNKYYSSEIFYLDFHTFAKKTLI